MTKNERVEFMTGRGSRNHSFESKLLGGEIAGCLGWAGGDDNFVHDIPVEPIQLAEIQERHTPVRARIGGCITLSGQQN